MRFQPSRLLPFRPRPNRLLRDRLRRNGLIGATRARVVLAGVLLVGAALGGCGGDEVTTVRSAAAPSVVASTSLAAPSTSTPLTADTGARSSVVAASSASADPSVPSAGSTGTSASTAVSPGTSEPTAAAPETEPNSGAESASTPPAAPSSGPAHPAAGPDENVVEAGFHASVGGIDDALAARMASSWRPGCPVQLADLSYLTVTYRGTDGADHLGELVVAASVADDVVAAFGQLYAVGYPIASMRLVDDFGGDDDASMAADNTSAFNCRPVTGGGGFSEHSYGTAVDVNPVENPYVRGGTVLPPAGGDYLSRPELPGVLHAGDAAVAAFASIGWSWGGSWSSPTDYQHFSLSGR